MFGFVKGCRKLAAAAVVAAAGFAGASGASAAEVTVGLETLMPGGANEGGITVTDKRYSNFQFSSSGTSVLRPQDVEVMIVTFENRHDLLFLFDLTASDGERSDLVLGYDLTALGPDTITSVDAGVDGGPFGPGDGRAAASMVETVTTHDGSDLVAGGPVRDTEIIALYGDGDEVGLPDTLEAVLAINPTRGLRFTKDIVVSARPGSTSLVGVSVIGQGVEQTTTVIPLPAAFWAAIPVFGALVGRKKLAGLLPTRD